MQCKPCFNSFFFQFYQQAEAVEKRREQIQAESEKKNEKLAAIHADAAEKRHKVSTASRGSEAGGRAGLTGDDRRRAHGKTHAS